VAEKDPVARFRELFEKVKASGLREPSACALATSDVSGAPSVRMVLLKGVDHGFVFFTNRESRKGGELAKDPRAALCFFWQLESQLQVRVEGDVEQTSDEESDAYFASRPRESQLGAWASRQSRTLERYELLAERVEMIDEEYKDAPIPRPRWWGGYRILPHTIEFWRQGAARLHHRELYRKDESGLWQAELLNP
jgi:pyridoxamine 5'-phosphate oxidase